MCVHAEFVGGPLDGQRIQVEPTCREYLHPVRWNGASEPPGHGSSVFERERLTWHKYARLCERDTTFAYIGESQWDE